MIASLAAFAAVALLTPLATRLLGRRVFAVIAIVPAAVFGMLLTWLPGVVAGDAGRRVRAVDPAARHRVLVPDRRARPAARPHRHRRRRARAALLHALLRRRRARRSAGSPRCCSPSPGSCSASSPPTTCSCCSCSGRLTSVLSYLLIGHYTGKQESRGAALQALTVTTFGGLAMLVGLVVLVVARGHQLARRAHRASGHGRRRRVGASRSCSSARSRSARSCPSTSGCPRPWPRRRRCPPTCTPPRW